MSKIKLLNGDCLELMKNIPDKSVDMILCDLPYGTTKNKWDVIIDFEKLWQQYNRIITDNGVICLWGQEPFASELRLSNLKMYRYDWIIEKNNATGFLNFKCMPLKAHEKVCVFYKKLPIYNPQFTEGKPYKYNRTNFSDNYGKQQITSGINDGKRYPRDVIKDKWSTTKSHPTEKPISILEYLIKTYTNENIMVLDNCMGSGSTGVACKNTNRNFIGIELDEEYFKIAKKRIEEEKR